jgi:hypothetical protein
VVFRMIGFAAVLRACREHESAARRREAFFGQGSAIDCGRARIGKTRPNLRGELHRNQAERTIAGMKVPYSRTAKWIR